jgi:hypothetical protein
MLEMLLGRTLSSGDKDEFLERPMDELSEDELSELLDSRQMDMECRCSIKLELESCSRLYLGEAEVKLANICCPLLSLSFSSADDLVSFAVVLGVVEAVELDNSCSWLYRSSLMSKYDVSSSSSSCGIKSAFIRSKAFQSIPLK